MSVLGAIAQWLRRPGGVAVVALRDSRAPSVSCAPSQPIIFIRKFRNCGFSFGFFEGLAWSVLNLD
jgi:hypothetical protein